jgi:hypothetical protein
MIHPVFQSLKFQLFLCLFLTLSAGLWIAFSDPFFPKVALVENPFPYRFAVLGFIPPLWLLYFRRKKIALVLLFTLTPALFVTNLNMLRPDLFFIWLCMLTLGFAQTREQVYNGFLVILAGMYLWTGIHKVHWDFVKNMAWVFEARLFGKAFPKWMLYSLAASIPVLEIILGLLCFSPKTMLRRILGIALHAGILVFLLAGRRNATMIPWNVALLLSHVVLVAKFDAVVLAQSNGLKVPAAIALVFPVLYFVNIWPGVLSWNMYSARIRHIYMPVTKELALNPPDYVREYVYRRDTLYVISLWEWADAATGGPHVSEPIFRERVIEACEKFLEENTQ